MKYIKNPSTTLICTSMMLALRSNANADAGVLFGISHNFSGETRLTVKVLSTQWGGNQGYD